MDSDLRDLVWLRASDTCEYCRLRQDHVPVSLQIEHIIAKQHGGKDDAENLALSCDRCNAYKGPNLSGIDPETHGIVTLFNPRTQDWDEHFMLDGAVMQGLTPCGRATIGVLNMNAPRRVRLRASLLDRGELGS